MLSQIFGNKSVLLWRHGDKAPSLGTVPEVWGQLAPMHLGLETAISRAADSLGCILKSEQEQCLKKILGY